MKSLNGIYVPDHIEMPTPEVEPGGFPPRMNIPQNAKTPRFGEAQTVRDVESVKGRWDELPQTKA